MQIQLPLPLPLPDLLESLPGPLPDFLKKHFLLWFHFQTHRKRHFWRTSSCCYLVAEQWSLSIFVPMCPFLSILFHIFPYLSWSWSWFQSQISNSGPGPGSGLCLFPGLVLVPDSDFQLWVWSWSWSDRQLSGSELLVLVPNWQFQGTAHHWLRPFLTTLYLIFVILIIQN